MSSRGPTYLVLPLRHRRCAAGDRVPNASNVVIHIVADEATVGVRTETPGHIIETNDLISAESPELPGW